MKRLLILLGLIGASPAAAQPVQPHPHQPLAGSAAAKADGAQDVELPVATHATQPVCSPDVPLVERSLACFAENSTSASGRWSLTTDGGVRLDGVRRRPEISSASAPEASAPASTPGSGASLSNYTGIGTGLTGGTHSGGSGYSGGSSYRRSYTSPSRHRPVQVRSYTRRDGTRVRAHTRSRPRR